jgi:hypothetical protein
MEWESRSKVSGQQSVNQQRLDGYDLIPYMSREGNFAPRYHLQTGSGYTQPPIKWVQVGLFPEMKGQGRKTNY